MRYVWDEPMPWMSEGEADAEYARHIGLERPQQAWILSDRDCWYRNPAYVGPPVGHPEDEMDYPPQDVTPQKNVGKIAYDIDDEIPF